MSDSATIMEIKRAVEDERLHLTEWEDEFLVSIQNWLDSGRDLTDKQDVALMRIYERLH